MAFDKNRKKLPKGISLRSDGRYMGRFTFKGESFALYDKNLKSLEKKLADLRYEVMHGIFAKEADITVESWFSTWITEYKTNSVKQGTVECYKDCFLYYVKPYIGKKKLKDIRPEHIQKHYNDLMAKKYSSSTITMVHTILISMYKQAIKNKIVKENPVALATLPRNKKKTERRVMSLKEQQTFLKYAESSKYYTLYCIALFTGMRNGELRALQWKDIDFKNGIIMVNGTLKYFTGQGYVKDTPKTSSSERTIPMLEGVSRIFKQHKLEQAKLKLSMGSDWCKSGKLGDLVFVSSAGNPISESSVASDINKIVSRINLDEKQKAVREQREFVLFEHMTAHTFRHTFATRGIENGIMPKVMQEILGHSTLAMTMDLYAHVLPDMKANEMMKIAYLL